MAKSMARRSKGAGTQFPLNKGSGPKTPPSNLPKMFKAPRGK